METEGSRRPERVEFDAAGEVVLAAEDPAYEDVAVKFLEHFAMITQAINLHGLWDEEDGFYYDRVRRPDGTSVPVRVRSMTGIIPMCAVAIGDPRVTGGLEELRSRILGFLRARPEYAPAVRLQELQSDGQLGQLVLETTVTKPHDSTELKVCVNGPDGRVAPTVQPEVLAPLGLILMRQADYALYATQPSGN